MISNSCGSSHLKGITACIVWLILMLAIPSEIQSQHLHHHEDDCLPACAVHRLQGRSSIGIYIQDDRLHDYDVKFYGIDLEVNPAGTFLMGEVTVLAEVVADSLRYFVLELTQELTVDAVLWNDIDLAWQHSQQVVEIDLAHFVQSGELLEIVVQYQGAPQPQGFFSGIQSASNSFGDRVLWTLSEPHNARQWFPCKQVLSDKADSVHITVTTPQGYMAASNGLLVHTQQLAGNRIRYHWKTWYPIAYYLISITVSNYQEFNFYAPMAGTADSVFVQNFIYNHPGVLEGLQESLLRTRDFMHLFSQKWGQYPFASEKYGHAQAPMGGGMEHQTLSTMGSFGFDITAHELAHHWFGNHVTCATWSDIWINEGFASYGEYLAREFLVGPEAARSWMSFAHNNIKSQPGGSVYVPPYDLGDIWRIFNGRLSYRKGAAILHQLRFELNDDALFFQVMEDFQQHFAHSVATGDDFRHTLETNTGKNWEWFFDQWYYGEGYPTYELQWWQQQGVLYIKSAQTASAAFPHFFKGTLEFRIVADGQEQIIRFFQDEPLQVFELAVEGEITEIVFDPGSFKLMYYTLSDSTGLVGPSETDIVIYPNPSRGRFLLDIPFAWQGGRYHIASILGNEVMNGGLFAETTELDLSLLPDGMYVLWLISPKGESFSAKLLKRP